MIVDDPSGFRVDPSGVRLDPNDVSFDPIDAAFFFHRFFLQGCRLSAAIRRQDLSYLFIHCIHSVMLKRICKQ